MIRFGISGMPPDDGDDGAFLDPLAARGHRAFELSFTGGFPWKERRCEQFGAAAAERGIALSIHAPYFAILTSDEDETAARLRAAVEHTMKLGRAAGARVVVVHAGHTGDRRPDEVHALVSAGLEAIEPKVRHLGVALGLEVAGTDRAFGTLGDIALIAEGFSFVRPVVDWAHVHAMSGGALTTREAFTAVFRFIRERFAGWAIDPLHCHFSDTEFGPHGEIRHVAYGDGTLRVEPLVAAAAELGVRMTVISEARDDPSHRAIEEAASVALAEAHPTPVAHGTRPVGSGAVPVDPLLVRADADAYVPVALERPVRLRNLDKPFFPGGETKGDLIQYYAAVAPALLPHLEGRAIVMARFPEGAEGPSFYEKRAPAHLPEWLPTAPLWSGHAGEAIEFVTAPDTASLLWIVNSGAIEIHPWLSRAVTADAPDAAVFDLDPAEGASWEQVGVVADLIGVALDRLGLAGYPKTSGATGLHVYVPLDPVHSYDRVRRFVETIGRMITTADPAAATMEWDIPKRAGKVFIDVNQNVGGKTIASVYSVRPRAGAPVSTPLLWEEVTAVDPGDFTIRTVWDRLRSHGDLFAPVLRGGQRLDGAERALGLG